ncbi:hypothetical protein AB4Z09_22525 [Rhodococcus sp. TAF43]
MATLSVRRIGAPHSTQPLGQCLQNMPSSYHRLPAEITVASVRDGDEG